MVVIGGGFSGTMVAAQLLRQAHAARTSLCVHLVERRSEICQGSAYATRESVHLLNVPASGMSAWPESPADFLEWNRQRRPEVGPSDFLPRRLYAEYLQDTLERVRAEARDWAELVIVHEEAERADMRTNGTWEVRLRSSTTPSTADGSGERPLERALRSLDRGSVASRCAGRDPAAG